MLNAGERWDLDLLRRAVRYQAWVVDALGPAVRGNVLEVGAGIGNFTGFVAERADTVLALEPESDLCEEIEGRRLPNVRAEAVTIERTDVPPESFDASVLINVLEHIDDDVAALRRVHDLLKPGGSACVLVPAHMFLYGSLDARYEHVRRYTKSELRERFSEAGLTPVSVRYFNPVGAIGWFIVGRIIRPSRLSRSSVSVSERVAVPIGRFLERLGSPPFGQSVVGIARRD